MLTPSEPYSILLEIEEQEGDEDALETINLVDDQQPEDEDEEDIEVIDDEQEEALLQ